MEFSHREVVTLMTLTGDDPNQTRRFGRALQHWTEQGILQTTTTDRGRGKHRRYELSQVVFAIILAALTNPFRGVSSFALEQLVSSIRVQNHREGNPIDLALTGSVPVPMKLQPIGELFLVTFPPTEDVQLDNRISMFFRLDILLKPLRTIIETRDATKA